MGNKSRIEHIGIVSELGNKLILVDLSVKSACAACHAKGVCGVDSAQKTVEVRTDKTSFNVGDVVNVIMQESLGMKALFLGYILPFIVLVAGLFVFLEIGFNELISGLISISMLLPYYLGLYFLRDRIKREFNFDIEKI